MAEIPNGAWRRSVAWNQPRSPWNSFNDVDVRASPLLHVAEIVLPPTLTPR